CRAGIVRFVHTKGRRASDIPSASAPSVFRGGARSIAPKRDHKDWLLHALWYVSLLGSGLPCFRHYWFITGFGVESARFTQADCGHPIFLVNAIFSPTKLNVHLEADRRNS